VVGVWGKARARELEGRGAGGDGTVYIDSLAEEIVLARLAAVHQRGRSFNLISEEAGEREYGGGETIVVDPIDGSHNAKMGIPYFSLTLAAAHDRTYGSVYEACVRNLVSGDHFEARRGGGARLNGQTLRLIDDSDNLDVLQIETTDLGNHIEEYAPLLRRAQKVRILGSAALNICLVASGAISLSIAPALRSVDCAAALLVLSEAGGEVTDLEGGELGGLDMALDVRPSVLAAGNRALLDGALGSRRPRP
jgi:myo-inositol-1(or 4)-monophosphatase